MSFTLGYNTNGFPHHRLIDAIDILAEIGYRSVGITLDYHALNPFEPFLESRTAEVWKRLNRHGMTCMIETGARYLLDPHRKHQPTLLDADSAAREHRLSFLRGAVHVASELSAPIVSIWSGAKPAGVGDEQAWNTLASTCAEVCDLAQKHGIEIGFEPEPGMFIETLDQYKTLVTHFKNGPPRLTLDLGHVHCLDDGNPADRIREFSGELRNIHIEDMRRGVHEHLMFGEGEMDFLPIFAALREVNYEGGVYVELSRHGHDAVNAAKKAFDFLSKM